MLLVNNNLISDLIYFSTNNLDISYKRFKNKYFNCYFYFHFHYYYFIIFYLMSRRYKHMLAFIHPSKFQELSPAPYLILINLIIYNSIITLFIDIIIIFILFDCHRDASSTLIIEAEPLSELDTMTCIILLHFTSFSLGPQISTAWTKCFPEWTLTNSGWPPTMIFIQYVN